MSDDQYVYETLSRTGVPVARLWWGPKSACPQGPYAIYNTREGDVYGDNSNVYRMPLFETTLYMDEWDDRLVDLYETAIASMGTYKRTDEWADEKFIAHWDFTLVRREVLV